MENPGAQAMLGFIYRTKKSKTKGQHKKMYKRLATRTTGLVIILSVMREEKGKECR
jgi:hypothetical protein